MAAPASAKLSVYLRSGIFLLLFALSAVVYATLAPLNLLFSFPIRYRVLTSWGALNVWLCARICGLRYRVKGLSNLPDQPSIVLASHQSTWETLFLSGLFPPAAWVVKRELLWIPFFGWGLAMTQPIAIDRGARKKASQQLVEQGRERLADSRWILIFPHGTRVAPGAQQRFKLGGALLASHTGAPVIPVAHNAGEFWPRRQFIKYPGTITISIGPAIDSRGRTAEFINAEAKSWIEAEEDLIRASADVRFGCA